jgi:hypothetical protein
VSVLKEAGLSEKYCGKVRKRLERTHLKQLNAKAREREALLTLQKKREIAKVFEDPALREAYAKKAEEDFARGNIKTTDISKWALEIQYEGITGFAKSAAFNLWDICDRIEWLERKFAQYKKDGSLPETLPEGVWLHDPEGEFLKWQEDHQLHYEERKWSHEFWQGKKKHLEELIAAKENEVVIAIPKSRTDKEKAAVIVHPLSETNNVDVVRVFYVLCCFLYIQDKRDMLLVAERDAEWTEEETPDDKQRFAIHGPECEAEYRRLQTGEKFHGGVIARFERTEEVMEFHTAEDAARSTGVEVDVINNAVSNARQTNNALWLPDGYSFSFGPLKRITDRNEALQNWTKKWPLPREKKPKTNLVVHAAKTNDKPERLIDNTFPKGTEVLYTDDEGKDTEGKITCCCVEKSKQMDEKVLMDEHVLMEMDEPERSVVTYNVKLPKQKVLKNVRPEQLVPKIYPYEHLASVEYILNPKLGEGQIVRCETVPIKVRFDPSRIYYVVKFGTKRYTIPHKDLLLLSANVHVEMSIEEIEEQEEEGTLDDFVVADKEMKAPGEGVTAEVVHLFSYFKDELGLGGQDAVLLAVRAMDEQGTDYLRQQLLGKYEDLNTLLREIDDFDETRLDGPEDWKYYMRMIVLANVTWKENFEPQKRASRIVLSDSESSESESSDSESSDGDDSENETIGEKLAKLAKN